MVVTSDQSVRAGAFDSMGHTRRAPCAATKAVDTIIDVKRNGPSKTQFDHVRRTG